MTWFNSYLFASAILLLPVAQGFFSWYVNIQAGWCNDNMQSCARSICNYMELPFCADSIRIQIYYDDITPHICSISNKRCKRVIRFDGRYDDRLPCSSNLDCLMGQKCRDGGCWNWKQFRNCTSDYQCDRRQYSCQGYECRLRSVDGSDTRVYNIRRCNDLWDRDCLPIEQGVSCNRNSDCYYEYICHNGQCILPDHKPKHCDDDRDCDRGYMCKDRECVYGSRTGGTSTRRMSCEDTTQCPLGQRCLNLECVNDRRSTVRNEKRRQQQRGKSCESTDQCPSGQRCLNLECV